MELQKVVEKDLWLAQVPAVATALGSVVLLAREQADRLALALAGLSAAVSVLVRGLAMEQEEATLSALGSAVLSVLVRGLATLSAAESSSALESAESLANKLVDTVHIPGGM